MSDWTGSRIYVAGHLGLVGRAIVRALEAKRNGGTDFDIVTRRRAEMDLADPAAVRTFFENTKPTHVVLAAAKVGGIKANQSAPVDFLLENLKIQNNVIEAAHGGGVRKLLFLGSSCVYPKFAPQPIQENSLLTGPLEPTNEWYAIAKIAGIKLCDAYRRQFGDNFISAMPSNIYGPWDNFDPETSHALPGMIYKFHQAKEAGSATVKLWGTGNSRREWLHADDAAEACLVLLEKFSESAPINVGAGEDCTIRDLAHIVRDVVGYTGEIEWDTTQPDGTPRKLLDVTRIRALGWKPRVELHRGIGEVYEWYLKNRVK
ncbi:MAG: GDP-L-fucose synthase [Verrucomicrobiota bacterium]|jgi:GDP-L-fucose synthase